MSLLLELNDAALSLHRDGRVSYRQPAIAYVNGEALAFGEAALKNARRHPQHANQQYLARLNADPLPRPGKQVANHADLIYRHLLELKPLADEPLVVAAPGFLTADQLGVLLGIAQEAGLQICGFVDVAVLMGSATALRSTAWLLDLHASRCCLTELRSDAGIVRGAVEVVAASGFNSCLDGWANLAADRFVQELRFDPMHAADAEQQLYDQLRTWTQRGELVELALEIRQEGTAKRVQLSPTALQEKLEQRLAPLADKVPAAAQLLVAPRSAALPGLLAALQGLGLRPEALPEDILGRAMALHGNALTELRLVTALPALAGAAAPGASMATAKAEAATHILHGHRAWPLAGNPFDLPEQGPAGKLIERDGQRFHLIAVEDSAAPPALGHG